MKRILGKISVLALIAIIGIQGKAIAQELAPKDRNRVPALLLTDPATNKTDRWESDGAGAAKVSIGGSSAPVTVAQGTSGVDSDAWNLILRNLAGVEYGLAASPFGVSLFDAASNLLGIPASPLAVGGTAADGAAVSGNPVLFAGGDGSGNTQIFAVDTAGHMSLPAAALSDGIGNNLMTYFPDTLGMLGPSGVGLWGFNGSTWDKLRSSVANGLDVDVTRLPALPAGTNEIGGIVSPTNEAYGTVSVTTAATLIVPASATRKSSLIRNADSNTVLFIGFDSSVTTANGLPLASAGATGATGNGGSVTYSHTGDIYGIVSSGTADTRFQTESK